MRTTVDIDDDILAAVKEIARRGRTPAGRVVSRMLRAALAGPTMNKKSAARSTTHAGFRPFTSRGVTVTTADIDRLRDAEDS